MVSVNKHGRSGTSRLWSLPSGLKGFCWIWAAAEGQEHMTMKFSYKDNWIRQRLTLKTCHRQVTNQDHGVFWTPLFFPSVSVHEGMTCGLVCRKVLTCCLVCQKVLRIALFESQGRTKPESTRYTTHISATYIAIALSSNKGFRTILAKFTKTGFVFVVSNINRASTLKITADMYFLRWTNTSVMSSCLKSSCPTITDNTENMSIKSIGWFEKCYHENFDRQISVFFKSSEFFYLLMLGWSIKLMSFSLGVPNPFVSSASWATRKPLFNKLILQR